MRLAATQRSHPLVGDGDGILTSARFHEAKDTVLGSMFPDGGAGTWVTPLLNRCEIARRADADGGSDGRMTSEADARVVLRPLGTARGKGVDGVRVLLAGEGEEGPTSRAAGVGRLYLALTGPGQLALANAYVSALDGLLGARRVTLDGYESSAMPVRYDSVACSLWATFLAHGGRYLMSCKRCGRTVLSTRQGPRREFCADTCRARYYMEQRTRRRPHAGGDTAVPLPKGPGPSVG